MLETALRLDMRFKGKRINKHKDIKNSWNEDQSDENAGKMYHVMFGDYESKNASWSKMMEVAIESTFQVSQWRSCRRDATSGLLRNQRQYR